MENSGVLRSAAYSKLVQERYGLPLEADVDHLRHIVEHYRAKREALFLEHGEMVAMTLPDYAKAVLISEAARAMLREIAPKRRKNRKDNR